MFIFGYFGTENLPIGYVAGRNNFQLKKKKERKKENNNQDDKSLIKLTKNWNNL